MFMMQDLIFSSIKFPVEKIGSLPCSSIERVLFLFPVRKDPGDNFLVSSTV
jgi:hypothetical protein